MLLCILAGATMQGQSLTDSLLRLIKKPAADTSRIKTLKLLSEEFRGKNIDSSLLFARRSIHLSQTLGQKFLEAACCGQLGDIFSSIGRFDSSLAYHNRALDIRRSLNNQRLVAGSLHNTAKALQYLGEYDKSVERYYQALKINEETGNLLWKAYNLIGIGGVYNFRGNDVKSIDNYRRALSILQEINNEQGIAYCLNNIGLIYNRSTNYTEAIVFLEKALELNKKLGNEEAVASNLGNLGVSWYNLKDHNKALKYYSDALSESERMNDKEGISIYLNAMANVFAKLKRLDKAIHFSERSLLIAREIKVQHQIKKCLSSLVEFSISRKDFERASNYQAQLIKLNDTIYSESDNKIIAETEAKYQTEKREKENLLLRQQKEIASEKEKKQRVISVSITGGLIVVLLFAFFIANRLKITNRQKKIIERQKHVVDEKQKEILDSITYARRLQEAILPPADFVKKHLPQSFVYYQPKDIVAGDFYWMEAFVSSKVETSASGEADETGNAEELVLIAAGDCTGHGVPGALVSVVCSTALNRSVHEFGLRDPGKILDKTRELVLETFSRSVTDVQDGMDISLACIRRSKKEIFVNWAGANNPLWYLQGGAMKEIQPNKQPIGKSDKVQPFTSHPLQLSTGDTLYFFTDGYADQFGGKKGKKFKYRSLKELLQNISALPMDEQKEVLANTLKVWKGDLEQVDDICVIGVRI